MGLTALTHAGTSLFAPISALMFLASGKPGKEVWQCSLAVVFAAALVVSPWTLRNYFTFGEFVPIRTGVGFMFYLGNSALADTFKPKRPPPTILLHLNRRGQQAAPGRRWL